MPPSRPLRILTWHVHGNYLYYLTHVPHTFYLPVDAQRTSGYAGRSGRLPWGENVREIAADDVRNAAFDCVLYQSHAAWQHDRHVLLSEAQRRLPAIFLEHDPPQGHPTDSRHPVDDPDVLLVHVTDFNRLMWDSGRTRTAVIEHGVRLLEPAAYTGELARGIAVVNHIVERGRRLGADVFEACRREVPLDLIGMSSTRAGGLGEIPNPALAAFIARYRFYLHPIRWTSLGLALIEAMMVGLPVVGLATTELVTVIRNGETGFVETDPARLVEPMRRLIADPGAARAIGAAGRRYAAERFGIDRFVSDWLGVLRRVAG